MKKIISLLLPMALLLFTINIVNAANVFEGGDGTAENPYLISTAEQLAVVSDFPTLNYKLLNDINYYSTLCNDNTFSGGFDGNGYCITGKNNWIFHSNSGDIKNLHIKNCLVTNYNYGNIENCEAVGSVKIDLNDYVGSMADYNEGHILNCNSILDIEFIRTKSTSSSEKYATYSGGIAGYNVGKIKKCYYGGTLTHITATQYSKSYNGNTVAYYLDYAYTGGIAGYNNSTITESYADSVNYTYSNRTASTGGIVGKNEGVISYCYFKGEIDSRYKDESYTSSVYNGTTQTSYVAIDAYAGGIASDNSGEVKDSYAISVLKADASIKDGKGSESIGGISAYGTGTVSNSYTTNSSLEYGGTYKSSLAMIIKETYADWDFHSTWDMTDSFNDGLPYLRWQSIPVSSMVLSNTEISLKQNETKMLSYTVLPDNATNKAVTWSSSDTAIATVDSDGIIKGISQGTATITATSSNHDITANCTVTVTDEVLVIYPYTVNNISLLDMQGNAITDANSDSSSYYVEMSVTKNNNDTNKDMFIVALYSDTNSLISMSYMKANLLQNQTVTFGGLLMNTQNQTPRTLKCFAWNNIGSMIPLSNSKQMLLNTETVDTVLESEHPYSNSIDETKAYTYDGECKRIEVTFEDGCMLDDGYDFVYVYDKDDNEIGKYTGNELSGRTLSVDGNIIKIRLTSDNRITDYGYKTKSIVVYK